MMHETLSPGFLIASPKLDDSPFERAVIAMVHHDDRGAMGFIINKPLDVDLGTLLQSADEKLSGEIDLACFGMTVHFGGPVRVEQLWLVYHDVPDKLESDAEPLSFDLQFDPRWYVVAAYESIERLAGGQDGLDFKPFVGYTGWGAGQLEQELEEGSWLFLPFNNDFVLSLSGEPLWEEALSRLGVDPMAFLMMGAAGRA